jgi:hypothetical protein
MEGVYRNIRLYPSSWSSRFPSLVSDWEDESPYPEVRAAVSNTDDMEMAADTVRAWTIGLLGAIIIPGLNQFLFFRYPSTSIGSVRRISSLNSQVLILTRHSAARSSTRLVSPRMRLGPFGSRS